MKKRYLKKRYFNKEMNAIIDKNGLICVWLDKAGKNNLIQNKDNFKPNLHQIEITNDSELESSFYHGCKINFDGVERTIVDYNENEKSVTIK